jgi:hypothetical protein
MSSIIGKYMSNYYRGGFATVDDSWRYFHTLTQSNSIADSIFNPYSNQPNFYKIIQKWLYYYEIPNCTINDDLTVDVDGDVNLYNKSLTAIPIKFGIVKGNFDCGYNQLTSTEFFPNEVYGNVFCYNNNLKNLNDFPKIVTGWIDIGINPNLENILGLWGCDFKGTEIRCGKKWKEEIECYLLSINRLKEVEIHVH